MTKNILFSSCTVNMKDYAIKMYKSFLKFNKNTPAYFGNINWTEEQLDELRSIGVKILNSDCWKIIVENKLRWNFIDFLIYPYLESGNVQFDKVMWIDVDTLILGNIEEVFDINADFIGHPGRTSKGAIMVEDNMVRFALGLWVTRSKELLRDLTKIIKTVNFSNEDSPILTKYITESRVLSHILGTTKYTVQQLDPSIWNFSRELVNDALIDEKGIYHKVYPKTIGFSVTNTGDRGSAKTIDNWYKEKVEGVKNENP